MSEPIHVTIFGAGVAGLSAAHELIERGFDVTVVEKRQDAFRPGACQVGGMARTQWARVPGYEFPSGPAPWQMVQTRPPVVLANAFKGNRKLFYDKTVRQNPQADLVEALCKEMPEVRFARNGVTLDRRAEARLEAMATYLKRYVDENLLWTDDGRPVRKNQDGCIPGDVVEHLFVEGYRDLGERPNVGLLRAHVVAKKLRRIFEHGDVGHGLKYSDFIEVTARDLGAALQNDWVLERKEKRIVRLRLREIILPGEHGYRFFPAFYRHVFDLMKRIPILDERPRTLEEFSRAVAGEDYLRQKRAGDPDPIGRYTFHGARGRARFKLVGTGRTAYDNLVSVSYHSIAQTERPELPAILSRTQPMSLSEALNAYRSAQEELGFEMLDMARYQLRLLQYITTCRARRGELASHSWSDFIGIDTYSEQFRDVMDIWPQALIGMRAYEADARTCGNISVQMLLDQIRAAGFRDGTLNAPTSIAWLEPWRQYLGDQGVKFVCAELTEINWEKRDGYPTFRVSPHVQIDAQAGYVILALPVEEAQRLVAEFRKRIEHDATARSQFDGSDLDALRQFVGWTRENSEDPHPLGPLQHFTGIQYYLEQDHALVRGHTYYANSAWGVTSISQAQFRADRPDWRQMYRGIVSVDIGSCYREGTDESEPLWTRTPDSIGREVWCQMNAGIGVLDEKLPDPLWYHIDDDLRFHDNNRGVSSNGTPYLLSFPKDFARRPGRVRLVRDPRAPERRALVEDFAYDVTFSKAKDFRGVVLAGSYMKTFTRLATMESANESARHAVNAILHDCDVREKDRKERRLHGRTGQPCHTWNIEDDEFPDLAWLKDLDARLFERGMPHFIDILDLDSILLSTSVPDPLQQIRKLSDALSDAKEFPWSLVKFGAPRDVLRALVSALSEAGGGSR